MSKAGEVIRTGEIYKDTRGFLSTAWFIITLGKEVVEYEKEKVLLSHPFDPFRLVQTMQEGYEVYYKVKKRTRIPNPTRSAKKL